MIPDYDCVVIDEAHELTARVTQAATDELSRRRRGARRPPSQRHVEGDQADDLDDAAGALAAAIEALLAGSLRPRSPTQLADALVLVRDAARACVSAFPKESGDEADAGRTQARGMAQDVFVTAERMAADVEARRALALRGR